MFWENFVKLCNKTHTSPTAVCAELGYSNAIATKWRRGSIPRSATLHKIADYFGVSVDYLLGSESADKKGSLTEPKLSEGEKELIDLFRQLPIESQKMYLEVLRASLRK